VNDLTARGWSVVCTALGSVLLLVGILAGLVNHNVLDGPRFAAHVDAVRRDPAVSRQVGQAITRRVLAADPNLIAVRPLIESVSTSLVGSPVFSPVVRAAARQLHGAFTDENPGQIVLRLVDVGAVLAGVLPALSPQAAARVPADLDVTLAQIGRRSYAAQTIHLTRLVGLLSWLLPLTGLLVLGAGIVIAPDRMRAAVRTGWGVTAGAVVVGVLALTATILASVLDEGTLRGALTAATLRVYGGPLWWAAGITAAAGGLIVLTAKARIAQVDLAAESRRIWTWLRRRPDRRWPGIARGAVFVAVGVGVILRPALVFGVLAGVAGIVLVLVGVGEIATAIRSKGVPGGARSWRALRGPATAVGVAVALVVALVAVDAAPAERRISTVAANTTGCNGHVELCDRRYNDVAFPATHNAMSAADEPGWFIPEQPTGLVGQLDAGVRVLLIDTWYGQTTQRPGVIATAPRSHAAALAEAKRLYGDAAVTSALRLRDAITTTPTGPVRPYLCHGLCEIGATEFEPAMVQVRAWLAAHPREVVTLFIEDSVTPADTAAALDQAGLGPYLHTQQRGQPWPTLGQMIDSGRRLVVLMERHGGGKKYPGLLPGFDVVQDTPFTNPTAADLSCVRNRGSAGSPLLLLNYWLSNLHQVVTDARKINAYDVLWPYLEKCRKERGMIPNYVAVNYYNEGDVFRAIDRLNGVH
jgi:uncharacterized membrane protein HdeD (DUF308 family)